METLKIIRKDKYVICEIDNGKVNAIDIELSNDLITFFEQAEVDDSIEGVILTGRPHCFSAGLNIMKLAAGVDAIKDFWRAHLRALQLMTSFSKPFIAAITGYAPAAGTTLACTADYRIMGRGKKHVIGMHEMKLSLVIPELMVRLYSHWIGSTKSMECFLHSRLMQADEALSIGLVNEACEVEEVLPRAEALMQQWTSYYVKANQNSKRYFKKELVQKLDMKIEPMIEEILESALDPMTLQKMMEFQMQIKVKK
ncbi:MAG: 3,2-trans-enoyl-CoA isomerase [Saprospiraceae bacterium]|jgi:3,2-trans-enoyl-CoA isomerase